MYHPVHVSYFTEFFTKSRKENCLKKLGVKNDSYIFNDWYGTILMYCIQEKREGYHTLEYTALC